MTALNKCLTGIELLYFDRSTSYAAKDKPVWSILVAAFDLYDFLFLNIIN